MSAVAVRPGLPRTSLRVGGEILAGAKLQVEPLESEVIERLLSGQHEAFRELFLRARLQMRDSLAPGMDGSWSTGRRDYEQVRAW